MSETYDLVVGKQGRVVIPKALRQRMAAEEGARYRAVVQDDGSVLLLSVEQAVERLRRAFLGDEPAPAGLVDELIAERRAAAAAEHAEDDA